MPTGKTIEVIKVTNDVYDINVALAHYKEERRAATYTPLLHMTEKVVHRTKRVAYCVCRIPAGPDDQAFIATVKRIAQQNYRKEYGIDTVPVTELFNVKRGSLVPAKVAA